MNRKRIALSAAIMVAVVFVLGVATFLPRARAQSQRQGVRVLEETYLRLEHGASDNSYNLTIACDPARGNVIYLAEYTIPGSGANDPRQGVTISVVHQPDKCK